MVAQLATLMAFLEVEAVLVVLLPALVVLEVEVAVGLRQFALVVHGCYHEAEEHEEELGLDW